MTESRASEFQPVLERGPLRRAVELQRRSYQLLRWLEDAFDRGFIRTEAVERYSTFEASAIAWLEEHYENLPARARPARSEVPAFARFFTTYLRTTFDLEHEPDERRFYRWVQFWGFRDAEPRRQHFIPRSIRRVDREAADVLRLEFVRALATVNGCATDVAERVGDRADLLRERSLCAYGADLLRRVEGVSQGTATLVLWRSLAWTDRGSPIKGYQLRTHDMLAAQATLAGALLHS